MRFKDFIDDKENHLEIQITSYREKGIPVSTVMKHRHKDGGKWQYDADLDSGEQGGAREIPSQVRSLLQAFGLPTCLN